MVATSQGGAIRPRLLRATCLAAALLLTSAVGACGGSDDSGVGDSEPAADSDEATTPPDTAADPADTAAEPDAVALCLETAGYEMVPSTELLSEQQVADQLAAFGQTDGLTFDAATSGFAGSVTFYETAEQAQQRADRLSEVATAQRVVGNALVNVEAGSGFEGAVAAAEACLQP